MPEEMIAIADIESDSMVQDAPRKCHGWAKSFQDLMEAHWSMDLGALMTSGHGGTDPELPSQRRKNLKAFFRGRLLMGLCAAAEGKKGQDILERCRSEGPETLVVEFAELASNTDHTSVAAVPNPPCVDDVCLPSADPPELPASCPLFNASVSADMLLAMFGTGGGPPDDVHDEHRVRFSHGSEDGTEVGQTAELCLVTSRLQAAESRLQELSRSPRTLEVLDEETSASTSSLDGHLPTESSPKLPKTRPKPLSVPAVAGPIRWAATPNGCLVEVAKDPKKYAERQAQKTEVRAKLDSHKIAPSWSSVGKALVLHGGKPLASKSHPSTVPASAYHKNKSIKHIMHQSSTMQSEHSEGVHPSDSLVAHVRDGFKNWWFQPDAKEKHEWQDFMAEEVEAPKSTVSTYGRTRSTIKGKKGHAAVGAEGGSGRR